MNHFATIDQALIERVFEPTAWHSEYRFGAGSPRLSRIATTASYVTCALCSLADGEYISFGLLVFFSFLHDAYIGARDEQAQIFFRSLGFPNPLRPLWDWRLKYLVVMVSLMTFLVMLAGPRWSIVTAASACTILNAISRWFDACESMPPSFKKEQEAKDAERSMQASEI